MRGLLDAGTIVVPNLPTLLILPCLVLEENSILGKSSREKRFPPVEIYAHFYPVAAHDFE